MRNIVLTGGGPWDGAKLKLINCATVFHKELGSGKHCAVYQFIDELDANGRAVFYFKGYSKKRGEQSRRRS